MASNTPTTKGDVMKKVYLSGGLRSNWQQKVIDSMDAEWLDPRTLMDMMPNLQGIADIELAWIDECDMVFAYLEYNNPSGLGLSAEIGYARAINKPVVLVDERDDMYSAFLHCLSDWHTDDLSEGIAHLKGIL